MKVAHAAAWTYCILLDVNTVLNIIFLVSLCAQLAGGGAQCSLRGPKTDTHQDWVWPGTCAWLLVPCMRVGFV